MKIYVVTGGEYSMYHIIAVKTNREEAEAIANLDSKYAEVEEWDTEDMKISWGRGSKCFRCTQPINGDKQIRVTVGMGDYEFGNSGEVWQQFFPHELCTQMIAEDEEHAMKIAADRFAQYRAMREGL